MAMKMRVMYSSKKGKVVTYAEAIGQACGCLVNDIPPAYPADKERLVLIVVTMNGEPNDAVRRFCSELYPNRAQNVALIIDGPEKSAGEATLRNILKQAGTNVLEEAYYLKKCGIFGKKITLEERQAIVDWARKMQQIVADQN